MIGVPNLSVLDVWSFGITLYEILNYGVTPYVGMTNEEVIEKVVTDYRLPCLDNCPDEIYQMMLKCWDKVPEQRPTFRFIYETLQRIYEEISGHHPSNHDSNMSLSSYNDDVITYNDNDNERVEPDYN